MGATRFSRRPPAGTRLIFSAFAFVGALSGLASAYAAMLSPAGAVHHSKLAVTMEAVTMEAAHLQEMPQSSGTIASADRLHEPIDPNCDENMCPAGCALGLDCTMGFATLSAALTPHTTPTLFMALATAPLHAGLIERILPSTRPPSLTALSISRICSHTQRRGIVPVHGREHSPRHRRHRAIAPSS